MSSRAERSILSPSMKLSSPPQHQLVEVSAFVGGVVGHGSAAALAVRAFEAGGRILAIERDLGGVRTVAHNKSAPGPRFIGCIAERRTRTMAECDIPEIE